MVAYEHDGNEYRYIGEPSEDGHFNLVGDGFDGRASLHMFKGGSIMEGFWRLHLE